MRGSVQDYNLLVVHSYLYGPARVQSLPIWYPKHDRNSPGHHSDPPQHLVFTWLPFLLVDSGLSILLPGKHTHQARKDVSVHNGLCEWLNVPGDVHPHVQHRLVGRVEIRRTGLRQDLRALRQVVDVEDPQEA